MGMVEQYDVWLHLIVFIEPMIDQYVLINLLKDNLKPPKYLEIQIIFQYCENNDAVLLYCYQYPLTATVQLPKSL